MGNLTATIILVSGTDPQARIIQKFQQIRDKKSGIYNHSGILFETAYGYYVVEQTQIEGRKWKAAARIRPLAHYTFNPDKYELLFLKPVFPLDLSIFEPILMKYCGVPYDYFNLLHDQVNRTLFNKWIGRVGKKAEKRTICHEHTQFIFNKYDPALFPEYYKGNVSDLFHSIHFKHLQIL